MCKIVYNRENSNRRIFVENKRSVRRSNFELMRIVAMLLIVTYHCVLHSEMESGMPLVFAPFCLNQAFAYLVGMWGMTGVGCFFLLTAYFQIGRGKVSTKKILLLILETVFWAFVTEAFTVIVLRKWQYTVKDAFHALISPLRGNYWFITSYLCLSLLIPFLNRIIEDLDEMTYRKLLIVFTVLSPVYSSIGDTRQTLCDLSIGIYYYLLWGYLSRHPGNRIEKNCKKIFFSVLLLSTAAACASSYIFSSMGKQAVGLPTIYGRASFIQVVLAVSLFYVFKNMEVGSSRVINFLAKPMLGVYLIHENEKLFPFIWNWILFIRTYFTTSPMFMPRMIGCVLLVFIVSMILEYIRMYLIEKPLAAAMRPLDPVFDRMDRWFVTKY